jgi:hypothetical protein
MDRTAGWVGQARETGARIFRRYGVALAIGLIVAALGIYFGPRVHLGWLARQRVLRAQRGEAEASDATVLYGRMLHFLERRGFEKPAWITPLEFARKLPSSELTPVVEDLTSAYNDLRFGGRREAAARMVTLLEQLEQL